MEIKYTIQGLLVYTTMALYLSAFLLTIAKCRKSGNFVYLTGFIVAVISFIYRWIAVKHVPMQNLFEVFLCLGMIYPVSLFSRRILKLNSQAADMLLGVIILIPAGFIFNADPQHLPPALQSWLFIPHVAVYVLSYIFMAKAAFYALNHFIGLSEDMKDFANPEESAYRLICVGFPLLTLGLILGSVWGQQAWGDYWGWDPKEMWSLASWLVYVGYFHFRYMYRRKYPGINSIWVISGLVVIIITLLWVNLSKIFSGLHNYAV